QVRWLRGRVWFPFWPTRVLPHSFYLCRATGEGPRSGGKVQFRPKLLKLCRTSNKHQGAHDKHQVKPVPACRVLIATIREPGKGGRYVILCFHVAYCLGFTYGRNSSF